MKIDKSKLTQIIKEELNSISKIKTLRREAGELNYEGEPYDQDPNADQGDPSGGIQTSDGKRLEQILGKFDTPKEFVDFLFLTKQILGNEVMQKRIRILASKAGWDKGDIAAVVRLSRELGAE